MTHKHIVDRRAINEWPLSLVQSLQFTDDSVLIYKSQYGPTVEVPFLSKAKSSLLAEVEVLYDEDGYSCMLCNHIKGSPLEKLELSETDLVSAGKDITREVEAISGTFPVYVDIGTVNLWQSFTD